MNTNSHYYLIDKDLLVRTDSQGFHVFHDARWVLTVKSSNMSADQSEERIKEISPQEAAKIAGKQLYDFLTEKWKVDFLEEKLEWYKNPKWYAKMVKTDYCYEGITYHLWPQNLNIRSNQQGFMESVQDEIEKDLIKYGATEVYSHGMLD
jgi:hypothetical protein